MGCVMIVPFLAQLGATASSKKEARLGGVMGALTFSLAVAVFAFGLLANIGDLYDKNVPALVIANRILPFIGAIFSIILISGVYTTAVPLLWLSRNRLFVDEKSNRFRVGAIAHPDRLLSQPFPLCRAGKCAVYHYRIPGYSSGFLHL